MDNQTWQFRAIEYIQRKSNLMHAQKQQLTSRDTVSDSLHVVYLLGHVIVCGGVKVVLEHANGLVDMGVRVTIISHFSKPDWFPLKADFRCIPFQIELAKGIPECDVIVATYWDQINACIETGIAPVVYFEQGDFHLFDWEKIPPDDKKAIFRQYQLPSTVFAVSHQIAALIKKNYNREAIVIHNAIDPGVFFPRSKEDQSAMCDRPYMLIVGSDGTKFKGIPDLKQAWLLVRQQGYELDLVWVTQTKPRERIGTVHIAPAQDKLGELYRKAFVYVSGSHYESFPLPGIEAMASGCPVVTTRNIGVQEYANEENCLFAEIGNPQSLADQIIRLLNDSDLYKNLQEQGYLTAQKFEWKEILAGLVEDYRKLGTKRPVKRNEMTDWVLQDSSFALRNASDEILLEKFLQWTNADEIQLPILRPYLEGHDIYEWKTVLKRNVPISGRIEKIMIPGVSQLDIPEPYLRAIMLLREEQYGQALSLFRDLYRGASDGGWKMVYLRWMALCLIEAGEDTQAEVLLTDGLETYPTYTDLMYLQGILYSLKGNRYQSRVVMQDVSMMKDAMAAPEFIGDLAKLSERYLEV